MNCVWDERLGLPEMNGEVGARGHEDEMLGLQPPHLLSLLLGWHAATQTLSTPGLLLQMYTQDTESISCPTIMYTVHSSVLWLLSGCMQTPVTESLTREFDRSSAIAGVYTQPPANTLTADCRHSSTIIITYQSVIIVSQSGTIVLWWLLICQ